MVILVVDDTPLPSSSQPPQFCNSHRVPLFRVNILQAFHSDIEFSVIATVQSTSTRGPFQKVQAWLVDGSLHQITPIHTAIIALAQRK